MIGNDGEGTGLTWMRASRVWEQSEGSICTYETIEEQRKLNENKD